MCCHMMFCTLLAACTVHCHFHAWVPVGCPSVNVHTSALIYEIKFESIFQILEIHPYAILILRAKKRSCDVQKLPLPKNLYKCTT